MEISIEKLQNSINKAKDKKKIPWRKLSKSNAISKLKILEEKYGKFCK